MDTEVAREEAERAAALDPDPDLYALVKYARTVVALYDREEFLERLCKDHMTRENTQRECIDKVRAGCSLCPVHDFCWYDGDHWGMTAAQAEVMGHG